MFTGIVEQKGRLRARTSDGPGARLVIEHAFGELELGESIAIDGVCLTVRRQQPGAFEADASKETLDRTRLGEIAPGSAVNLERAMAIGDRLGGHLVSGHVDATGKLLERTPVGSSVRMVFGYPAELARFIAAKGSIAINGVSLTVNEVSDPPRGAPPGELHQFAIMVIPHTLEVTTLGELAPGSRVNLEVDLVARYVLRAQDVAAAPSEASEERWMGLLARAGYV